MDWMLMPYRRYFDFSGRSRRKEYWMFALLMALVYAVAGSLMVAGGLPAIWTSTGGSPAFSPLFWVGAVIAGVFFIGSFIPAVAVSVRRLHDLGYSGWWYLGVLVVGQVPYLGALVNLVFLVVTCLNGNIGSNRFGPDPKDPVQVEVFA